MATKKLVIEVTRTYTFTLEVPEEFAKEVLVRQAELKDEDHAERILLTDQIFSENQEGWNKGIANDHDYVDTVTCITEA